MIISLGRSVSDNRTQGEARKEGWVLVPGEEDNVQHWVKDSNKEEDELKEEHKHVNKKEVSYNTKEDNEHTLEEEDNHKLKEEEKDKHKDEKEDKNKIENEDDN